MYCCLLSMGLHVRKCMFIVPPCHFVMAGFEWSLSRLRYKMGGVHLIRTHPTPDQEYGDELEEYFKLCLEDFDKCHPLEWWHACKGQFPHLYHLACNILLIPGVSQYLY